MTIGSLKFLVALLKVLVNIDFLVFYFLKKFTSKMLDFFSLVLPLSYRCLVEFLVVVKGDIT